MQLSNYIRVYPVDDDPGRLLLYSTRKGSKVMIRKETFRAIEENTLSSGDSKVLADMKMVVEDRDAERQEMLSLFERINKKNTELDITVVLNLDCNFACVYCYEGKAKGDHYMSDETEDRLMAFIEKRLTEKHKTVNIDLYGGEPLLGMDRIRSIMGRGKAIAEKRGIDCNFNMVSNGSLLTPKVGAELAELGLNSVKITLDGLAEEHNRTRPFKSGAGSFDAIIRNIKANCDRIKIGISGIYNRENYRKFLPLLDFLMEEGLTGDRLYQVKFDPVMVNPGENNTVKVPEGPCSTPNQPWVMEAELFLREALLKRGYSTPKPAVFTCMVEMDDSLVVNYDGSLYKCPGFLGREEFVVGSLDSGVGDFTDTYNVGLWNNKECGECPYLPLCFGGCRYMAFAEFGNTDKFECRKTYFDANLETIIKQDLTYQNR